MIARNCIQALASTVERADRKLTFLLEEGQSTLGFGQLLEEAAAGAAWLRSSGVEPGDRVGICGPNRPDWVRALFSIWMVGAVAVPFQIPIRLRDPQAAREKVRALANAASCSLVLAFPPLLGIVPEGIGRSWEELVGPGLPRDAADFPDLGPAEPAVIQFTSGSTATPKGALLTHGAIVAACESARVSWEHDPDRDVVAAWLPFFHDFGLFGTVMAPLYSGFPAVLLPTERFASRPAGWFELASETRATMTFGPPSACAAALRHAGRHPSKIDLSELRIFGLAAETIDPSVVDRLRDFGAPNGLREEVPLAAYGMSEATLGITSTRPDEILRIDRVDPRELRVAGAAVPAEAPQGRRIVSCGSPMAGMEVRVLAAGQPAAERLVGAIEVKGRPLMEGYVGGDGADPFTKGWLRTGDLGYMAEGDLYVTGRTKEVIIVLGQNHAPEELEWAAGRVDGVRPGRCVAFARPGTEGEAVVAVEARPGAAPTDLARRIRTAVADAVGIMPRAVLVLPEGTIEKTTSGKIRRGAMKERYARGELASLAAAGSRPARPDGRASRKPSDTLRGS